MNYDLDKFGLSEEELFSPVDNSSLESEKITAPRYSYWHSVFRVFFKKKINIAVLCLLGVILLMTYVYPLFVEYDRFANLMNGATKHLSPSRILRPSSFAFSSSITADALSMMERTSPMPKIREAIRSG